MKRFRGNFREQSDVRPWAHSKEKSGQTNPAPVPQSAQTPLAEPEFPVQPTAPTSRDSQTPSAEVEIRTLRDASNHAIATGDLLAVSSALASNFIVIIGDGTQLSRAAYLEAFAAIFEQSTSVRYERTADTVRISGPLPIAAEHGRWTGTLPDGTVSCSGTYMAMWRQTNSRWQLRSELFVTLA